VNPREHAVIARLITAAERVRQLNLIRDVPMLVEDAEAIRAYVGREIRESDLEVAQAVYTALGLLEPNIDVREMLLGVMAEQIVGYYDAREGRLVVRDDVMASLVKPSKDAVDAELIEARIVLVHEIVHALQDQHLGLSERVEIEQDTDVDNAYRALIEGDASLAMIGYALEQDGVQLTQLTADAARLEALSQVVRSSPLTGSELMQAPAIVRVPLLSAYVDGLAFAARLHGSGGWASVDAAHREPPRSTEQILHPDRFEAGEMPRTAEIPGLSDALAEAALQPLHEDTLGELELGVYFAQTGTPEKAQRAAAGWAGDRLYAHRNAAGETSIVWSLLWDDENEAKEAEAAAHGVYEALRPDERAKALVQREARRLLLVRGLDPSVHGTVRQHFDGVR
jgi:hypothetical protein